MDRNLDRLNPRQKAETEKTIAAAEDWLSPAGPWGGSSIRLTLRAKALAKEYLAAMEQPKTLRAALLGGKGKDLEAYLFMLRQTAKEIDSKATAWLRKWGGSEPPANRPFKGM